MTSRCLRRSAAFFTLTLAVSSTLSAHGPHKPETPPGATSAVAAIPLPAGWSASPPPATAGAMAPALFADGEGFLATWIEPVESGSPGIMRVRVASWRDGSWSVPVTTRESAALFANWADVPGVVRSGDGALYLWWLESAGSGKYTYEVRLARSTDQGATFTALGVLHDDRSPSEHGFVSATTEGKAVRFYYLDGRATPDKQPMQLRTVLVEGERIGPSELVDDGVCDCCSTSAVAVALAGGGGAVAYRDRTAGEIRDVQVAVRSNAGGLVTRAVATDGWKIEGCPVNGPAIAANGGKLAVAWFAAPRDRPRISFALSSDGGAAWSAAAPVPVSAGEKPRGQVGLAPVGDGFALSWLETIPGGAELRLARIDSSGQLAPSVAIARTGSGRAAGIPRLAAAGNRLALLWVDSTPANGPALRFAIGPP